MLWYSNFLQRWGCQIQKIISAPVDETVCMEVTFWQPWLLWRCNCHQRLSAGRSGVYKAIGSCLLQDPHSPQRVAAAAALVHFLSSLEKNKIWMVHFARDFSFNHVFIERKCWNAGRSRDGCSGRPRIFPLLLSLCSGLLPKN